MSSPWAFTHDPPTFGEMYDLSVWRSLIADPERMQPEKLIAIARLLISRDRSEPRHTVQDVMALDFEEVAPLIDLMMKGLVESGTTIKLKEQFEKQFKKGER